MKKLILSLIVSILFAVSVQAQVAPEQARNYQINEAHTGAINVSGVLPPLKQKWSRNFGQDMSYPLIVDGKVFVTVRYAGVFGTELYALNAADGATLWSTPWWYRPNSRTDGSASDHRTRDVHRADVLVPARPFARVPLLQRVIPPHTRAFVEAP